MIQTVYLAGPYTGSWPLGIAENVKKAIDMAEAVSSMGFYPFVPHLFHYWDQQFPHQYNFWMAQDAIWVVKCDAVLMYEESPGALEDVKLADQFGIPVFRHLAQLAAAKLEQSKI